MLISSPSLAQTGGLEKKVKFKVGAVRFRINLRPQRVSRSQRLFDFGLSLYVCQEFDSAPRCEGCRRGAWSPPVLRLVF